MDWPRAGAKGHLRQLEIKRFGWVRDIPDRRDLRYSPPPQLAAALPPKADLRTGFQPCYDQGLLGSCTANAIAGALQYLECKEGEKPPVMPSRLFVYYNERALEGSVGSDSGAQIQAWYSAWWAPALAFGAGVISFDHAPWRCPDGPRESIGSAAVTP